MTKIRPLLLEIFALLLASSLAAAATAPYTDIRETRLENGLTVLTREVRAAPVVCVSIFYGVGSRNEHTGITGASHLLEHMLFKGTEKFPKGSIETLVRQRGGVSNAATSTDFTYYWHLIQSDYLDLMLEIEADRMRGALISPEDLSSEMVVVRSELEGRENSPDTLLYDLVNAAAFTAHPYQWPIIGWRSDVEGMSRDQIYAHYRTHYLPGNATVVLVGDFDTDEAVEAVRRHFSNLEAAPLAPPVHTVEPAQRGERRATLEGEGSLERVLLAWRIPDGTHEDIPALDVLEQILSGGRASRLHQALVESGLATAVWAYSASRKDPSLFYIGATAQQGRTAQELEDAILREIRRIQEEEPSAEETARAIRQIRASFVFTGDDLRAQARVIGSFAVTTGLEKLKSYLPAIEKVSPADVSRAARSYLTRQAMTAGHFLPTGGTRPEAPSSPPLMQQHYRTEDQAVAEAPAPPATSDPPSSRKIQPARFELENGLTLIVLDNPANPSISIAGRLNAGSWLEEGFPRGTSRLMTEMLTRGSARRSSLEFATAVEDLGASLSFSPGVEGTLISGKCLSGDFRRWAGLLAEALREPAFDAEELEKARRVVLSRLDAQKESPAAVAERALMNALYPSGHPYHPGTLEEEREALLGVQVAHLRDFHRRFVGPRGTVLAVVGDIRPEECLQAVQEAFSEWEPQSGYRSAEIPDPPSVPSRTIVIPLPGKSETTILWGWHAKLKRSDPDYYAATVMNDILGGSVLSSRLGKSIRSESGLVYDVRSSFRATLGAGPWSASLGVNPANAVQAVRQLREEVERMRTEGPTQQEVEEARRFITGVLSLRLASNDGIASFLEASETYGLGLRYLEEFRSLYGGVTQEQAAKAARRLLTPEEAVLVVTGATEGFDESNRSEEN
ncbi:MAG: proteinase [Armatimonadota bacterium]|nr:MAG: proteinase [Armatimonadota bacterium]